MGKDDRLRSKEVDRNYWEEDRGGTYSMDWGAIQTGANHRVERSPTAETRDFLLGNIFWGIFCIKDLLNYRKSSFPNCRWENEISNLA